MHISSMLRVSAKFNCKQRSNSINHTNKQQIKGKPKQIIRADHNSQQIPKHSQIQSLEKLPVIGSTISIKKNA